LIEKIFDINDRAYQELIMIDLPTFLEYPRIERLYPFLERDYEEASQIVKLQKAALGSGKKELRDTFCNFEDFLNHPDLPEFYSEKITYNLVERYNDYENRDDEIVGDINHKLIHASMAAQEAAEEEEREREEEEIEMRMIAAPPAQRESSREASSPAPKVQKKATKPTPKSKGKSSPRKTASPRPNVAFKKAADDSDEFDEGGSFEYDGGAKESSWKFWKGKKVTTFMDEKDHSCGFGEENTKTVEVEHSCVDFTILVIGKKIRGVLEENKWNIQFNDEALADMMYIEDEEHEDFYHLDIVKKIIDYQFNTKVKPFLNFMFKFYVLGFVVPFILTMTIEWVLLLNILYSICLFVQLFFISFEWVQLK
jgi:hypothetical protein